MIEKITNNQSSDVLNERTVKRTSDLPSYGDNGADASLHVRYGALFEKAGQEPVEDTKIVERARQMLLSGELDHPENIRKAAKNILQSGI